MIITTKKKYHGLQNIWLYEYLNMQYVKRNKKASVLKNKNENTALCIPILPTFECGQTYKKKQRLHLDQIQSKDQNIDVVDHFHQPPPKIKSVKEST